MAVIEKSGLMKYKDKSGNTYLMYPITNTDNVDGLEEAIAEAKPFIVTVAQNGPSITADKTYAEIKAAFEAGRVCIAYHTLMMVTFMLTGFLPDDDSAYFNATANGADIYLSVNSAGGVVIDQTRGQDRITVSGLLKGNGNGSVSAATAGTDYVTPDVMNAAIEATAPFIVTGTATGSGKLTLDKTHAEIKAAYDAKKLCILMYYDHIMPLVYANSLQAEFCSTNETADGFGWMHAAITNAGTTSLYSKPLVTKVTVDTAMSTTSENPVQNKVVAAAIDSAIQSAIQNTWEASY